MHLVGYLYEDYHDARSLEHKVQTTYLRHALSWDVAQLRLMVSYRRVGKTYRSHLQGSSSPTINFLWDLTRSPKASVTINLRCVTAQKNEDLIYTAAEA